MKENLAEFVRQLFTEKPETQNWPSRTVARYLVEYHFEHFPSVENARQTVRSVRGKHGVQTRKDHKNTSGKFYDPEIIYDLPRSISDVYEPFTIPVGNSNMLLLSDIHVPFHDEEALRVAILYGKKQGINTILLNGDTADQYWTSPFVKVGHRHPFTYKQELDAVRYFLDWIAEEFPKAKIYYKIGNHEDRLEAYIAKNAPEFRGIEDFGIEHLFDLRGRGIEIIRSEQFINYGRLKIVHYHEFGRGGGYSPVNMARSLYLKAKQGAICGHGHITSENTVTKMDGSIITCWSVGCLCELHAPYRPLGDINHGFAHITQGKDTFTVHNKRIYRGKIL